MAVLGVAVVVLVRSLIDGHLIAPMAIVASEKDDSIVHQAIEVPTSWTTWITFLWPLPFAVRGARNLPANTIIATAFGLAAALVLGIWNGSGANVVRPMFDVAGPALCLAFAIGVNKTETGI